MFKFKELLTCFVMVTSFVQISAVHAQVPGPQHVLKQQANSYSVQVGEIRVTSLTNGTVPQDLHQLLKRTNPESIERLLARNFQSNPVEASINVFLMDMPGHRILVDTGSGQLFGPDSGGRLIESLGNQGIKPQDITEVLLTHAHSDHSGGLVNDDSRVFPNATIFIGKPDIDFFFNQKNQKKSGYAQEYFDIARLTLKPYLDAGKIKTFSGNEEVLPGITAVIHPGHTPGSAFYRLVSGDEEITFIGDIIHVSAIQFPNPQVTIAYDENQDQASLVRKNAFSQFAKNGELIAAPHLPFPGIGHIRKVANNSYDWVPVTYTNRKEK